MDSKFITLETNRKTSDERLEEKINTWCERLETKIDTPARELKAAIAELEAKMDSQESRLIRWIVATNLGAASILFTLLQISPSWSICCPAENS